MKLYIPKIGDTIQLTEAWKFPLHPEYRNVSLGAYLGYVPYNNRIWTKQENMANVRSVKWEQPNSQDFYTKKEDGSTNYAIPFDRKGYNEAMELRKSLYTFHLSEWGEPLLNVELPAGTVLKVSRLYIKQGAGDYNSITFYAKNLTGSGKGKKPKALRFWAKLDDCNNIEFEKIEEEKK